MPIYLAHVIHDTDRIEIFHEGQWADVTSSWSTESRHPSEFNLEQFFMSALDRLADGDIDRIRVNGEVFEESDVERIYEEQTGEKLHPKEER